MSNLKYNIFIGRYQPLHEGHKKLMKVILDEGKNILVLLRDTGINESNPYNFEERYLMFMDAFPDEVHSGKMRIEQFKGADIEGVCYGRKVGYGVREIHLDEKTEQISATEIRRNINPTEDITDIYVLDYII